MNEAVLPEAQRPNPDPPKLIVTVVWDAGGRDVLAAHPHSWPYLKSLIPKGTWYDDASVGSSPTSTAQIHASIGTGAFPDDHLLVGHRLRVGNNIVTPWAQGPNLIVLPTLADLYDRAMGNQPIVGISATVNIHFGMMSHGSFFNGGDRDIGTTRSVTDPGTLTDEGFTWNLPHQIQPYYRLPSYVNDVPGFAKDVDAVDRADGRKDGKWRNNSIDQLLQGFDTPARIPYQERVLETMITHEGFGQDDVPDLLYANFKEIDYISHIWSMNSPEMDDAVRLQDAALKQLVDLPERAGREGAVGDGADRRPRRDPLPEGVGRLPDLDGADRRRAGGGLRHRRRRRADRGADPADADLREHRRAAPERRHARGHGALDHGPDGGEHPRPRRHRAGRRAERQGLRGILPVRAS